jgi:predicted DNA-binding transcriptional regulator YafY
MSVSTSHLNNTRTARLLWLAMYCQRQRVFDAKEVQTRLGISQRSFMRCMLTLRDAGCIVDYDCGSRRWRYYCWDSQLAPVRKG